MIYKLKHEHFKMPFPAIFDSLYLFYDYFVIFFSIVFSLPVLLVGMIEL